MTNKLKALNELLADKTLSFGCRVKVVWEEEDETLNVLEVVGDFIRTDCWHLQYKHFHKSDPHYEILGHPVTLARVLLKLGGQHSANGQGVVRKLTSYENCDFYWDMEKDNLESQSEETINFLFELFNPKD